MKSLKEFARAINFQVKILFRAVKYLRACKSRMMLLINLYRHASSVKIISSITNKRIMQRSDSSPYPCHKSAHRDLKLSFSIKTAAKILGENRKSFSRRTWERENEFSSGPSCCWCFPGGDHQQLLAKLHFLANFSMQCLKVCKVASLRKLKRISWKQWMSDCKAFISYRAFRLFGNFNSSPID